jgi:hypothetical protein
LARAFAAPAAALGKELVVPEPQWKDLYYRHLAIRLQQQQQLLLPWLLPRLLLQGIVEA